ncbi:hypothetical protein EBT16_12700 [bacterium]|nr:hypothetical protein [bacterium]
MFSKKNWPLIVLPNLLLLMNQAFPRSQQPLFDEGYLGKEEQVWIKYQGEGKTQFRGVWATRSEQKNISGIRQGSYFLFQSEATTWKARLNMTEKKCGLTLEIHRDNSTEKKLLRANYCL